jgi:uncharacterized protein YaiI (UPF0178 family)
MRVFVDGDAFPNLLKPILLKQIERLSLETFVISNKKITIGNSQHVTYQIVELGADEADHHIVKMAHEGDLVITADIPLAAEAIEKGAITLNPRGELYTTENIKDRLQMRDFMDTLRSSGIQTGGPPPLDQGDRQAFANQLDRWLARVG